MAHTYESIRELDEERNGKNRLIEMSIEKYMEPRPFRKIGPWGQEEIDETTIGYVCNEREARLSKRWKEPPGDLVEKERCVRQYPTGLANSSNRVRVKNVYTGILFEFSAMTDSARFLGATRNNMSFGILDKEARVFCVGQAKFVFEYDGVERSNGYEIAEKVLDGFVEVVSSTGKRRRFDSYLLVAIRLGLLIGHIKEEEKRWKNNQFAKRYVCGKYVYTIEFNGEERDIDDSNGIHCHWKGIYGGDGDCERGKVMITQGNPQPM